MGRIERKQISVLKEDYICDVFVKESALLRSIRLSAPSVAAHMQLSPIEGSVLSFFIKMQNPSKILEIGTFVGYSAACMASVMSVSAFLTCVEKNNEYYKIAKQNLAHFSNVGIVNDDAKKTLQGIQGEFDLVFLDADKSSYCIYLDYIELFLRKGGLLISDNTLLLAKYLIDHLLI